MASTEDAPSAVEPAAPANPQPATKTSVPPKRPSPATKTTPSKASSFMNPTSTTAARSTTGSTLNKPPARPTSTTAVKKPAAGTPTSASAHRSRPSLTSNDESNKSGASGDEKKTNGINKPAKRMSLAAGSMGRASAPKAVSATADRRSTIQPLPASERKPVIRASTLSPAKSKAPTTPASRTSASNTPRTSTRPLASSLRKTSVSEGKTRLSTIPDSPVVNIEPSEDVKENTLSPRPPLGQRQSTRSVVLQQRMREFELVNEMLHAAIAAEDGGDEVKREQLENKASGSMAKLKNDIEKVRAFEKQHGRTPTEAELSAEAETERDLVAVAASSAQHANEESIKLKAELEESQFKVQALTKEIEEIQLKMTEFGLAAEEEASNVQSAKEALRKEIEQLESREHTRAAQALKDLEEARANAAQAATDAARVEQTAQIDELAASHSKEVADLRKRVEEAETGEQTRAQQALKELEEVRATATRAGDSMAQELQKQQEAFQEQLDKRDRELTGQNNVIKSLQDELERFKHSHDDLEAATRSAHEADAAKHDAQLRKLKEEHDQQIVSLTSARDSKAQEIQNLGTVIGRLQEEIQSVHDAKVDEHKAQLEKLNKDHEDVVSRLKAAQDSKEQEIQKLGGVIGQLQNELQSLHNTKADENEGQVRQLKDEHDKVILSMKAGHEEALETQKSQIERQHEAHVASIKAEHQQSLGTLKDGHERELQAHEDAASTAKAELEKGKLAAETSKTRFDAEIDKLRAESEASQAAAAQAHSALRNSQADLDAVHTQVTSLQQVLETLEKENVTRDEHHASLLKKARSEAEEAARTLHEAEKTELAVKHETLISELQAQHDESLSEARASVEMASAQHAKELQAKDDELAKTRADMEAESAKQTQLLQSEHSESLTQIRTEMAAAYAQHEQLAQKSKAEKDEIERQLQSDLVKAQNDAAESRKLAEELQESVKKIQEEATESSKLAAKAQEDVKESSKLAAELQAEIAKAQDEAREADKSVQELRAEVAKAQDEAKESSKMAEELRAEVTKAQDEAKESSKMAEELRAEVAKAQDEAKESSKKAEELQATVIKAQEDAKESNKLVEELQAKVSEDQENIVKLTAAAEDASKAIESRNNEDALKQAGESDPEELVMLKQQLDGALQEVETQRALNDKAEEAAEQSKVKIRELEASLKVTKAELTEAKTTRTNGVDFLRGPTAEVSSNGNDSPGLGDSKWATAEATTPEQTDSDDRGAAIQGTMASMQEEVRQLKEINDDFLEDHARMARILSNVPPADSPVNTTPSQSRPVTSGTSD